MTQSTLRLVAREHAVCELERFRAGQGGGHEALQLPACCELGDDAFEHTVAGERTRDLLRQRTGEGVVEDAGDLGRRQHFVYRLFERPAPGAGGCPRWEERDPSGSVGKPGAVLVVHWRAIATRRSSSGAI